MKHTWFTLLLVIAPAFAQQPQTEPRALKHCYVDAWNVSNYDEMKTHWQASWGSYDRTQHHRLGLKVRVGTTDSAGGRVKVDWY